SGQRALPVHVPLTQAPEPPQRISAWRTGHVIVGSAERQAPPPRTTLFAQLLAVITQSKPIRFPDEPIRSRTPRANPAQTVFGLVGVLVSVLYRLPEQPQILLVSQPASRLAAAAPELCGPGLRQSRSGAVNSNHRINLCNLQPDNFAGARDH